MKLVELPNPVIEGANLIGGRWVQPADRPAIDVRSPYTGEVIGRVPDSGAEEVAAAVAAAEPAARAWAQVPIKERSAVLFDFRHIVREHLDELAHLAAAEAGKTVDEARAGVLKGIEVLEYALSLQNLDQGGALEVSRGVTCQVRREPLGVVAGIAPFNFPAMVPMWQYPIALALGNAFVLKPSEKVPLTSCRMGDLLQRAGLPAGVFSIVHGRRAAVEALVDHPGIKAYGFVGSSGAAHAVHERAAARGKRALCLGGAKNHLIVVPDADPDLTVEGVVASFTGCAGQRCMAASLLVAVGDVDRILDAVVERAGRIRLGADMGAIIDRDALERLQRDIAQAERDGATLRLDGRRVPAPTGYEGGNWLAPTVIDRATPSMTCATKELFGPVLTIVRVRTLEEALALQGDSEYGNALSVFTTRGAVAQRVVEAAPTGMVGVNIGVPVPREPFSFGGTKASRFGHGDMTGQGGVELWSYLKKVTTKWAAAADANWMS
jgi:malonate-semialdehyde dehydrogenase (acetylating) / methylmalonate-semialdehyde dehydrogenase